MGRLQPSSDEGAPESVLAAGSQETLSNEMLDWLRGVEARLEQEHAGYADTSEESRVYSWLRAQVGWVLRTTSEQKAWRSASEHEDGVIYVLKQLRSVTQDHLGAAITRRYSPRYIQTLQKLHAELMLELDEFV